jgi:hypothetical protein
MNGPTYTWQRSTSSSSNMALTPRRQAARRRSCGVEARPFGRAGVRTSRRQSLDGDAVYPLETEGYLFGDRFIRNIGVNDFNACIVLGGSSHRETSPLRGRRPSPHRSGSGVWRVSGSNKTSGHSVPGPRSQKKPAEAGFKKDCEGMGCRVRGEEPSLERRASVASVVKPDRTSPSTVCPVSYLNDPTKSPQLREDRITEPCQAV